MTPELLPAATKAGPVADSPCPISVGARHRAPEPESGYAPDETTVIVGGWAAYGRHAAPASDADKGMFLPPLPLRAGSAAAAARSRPRPPVADLHVGADDAPGCPLPVSDSGPDGATAPDRAAARTGGIVRRYLGAWRGQRAAG